jgi:tRNA A37 threonylcarbamoyladenosine synthetase subunit TsaC/SUA5/YrdC
MERLPTGRAEVKAWATPEKFTETLLAIIVPPSKKVTVPSATEADDDIVAVRVTGAPNVLGFADDVSVVVVTSLLIVIVWMTAGAAL